MRHSRNHNAVTSFMLGLRFRWALNFGNCVVEACCITWVPTPMVKMNWLVRAPLLLPLVSFLLLRKGQARGVRCTNFGSPAPSHGDCAAPADVGSHCSQVPVASSSTAPSSSLICSLAVSASSDAVGTPGRLLETRHSRVSLATARSRS